MEDVEEGERDEGFVRAGGGVLSLGTGMGGGSRSDGDRPRLRAIWLS